MREEIMKFIREEFGTDDLEEVSALLSDGSFAAHLARFVVNLLRGEG